MRARSNNGACFRVANYPGIIFVAKLKSKAPQAFYYFVSSPAAQSMKPVLFWQVVMRLAAFDHESLNQRLHLAKSATTKSTRNI